MIQRSWGYATAVFHRLRHLHVVDLAVLLGVVGGLWGLFSLGREWTGALRPTVDINLDNPLLLFEYTFYSLCRGLIAYAISLHCGWSGRRSVTFRCVAAWVARRCHDFIDAILDTGVQRTKPKRRRAQARLPYSLAQ